MNYTVNCRLQFSRFGSYGRGIKWNCSQMTVFHIFWEVGNISWWSLKFISHILQGHHIIRNTKPRYQKPPTKESLCELEIPLQNSHRFVGRPSHIPLPWGHVSYDTQTHASLCGAFGVRCWLSSIKFCLRTFLYYLLLADTWLVALVSLFGG